MQTARKLLTVLGSGAAAAVDVADELINTYGFNELWKFTDVTSGTNVPAYVDSDRDATLTGLTLQNRSSPVVGDSGALPFWDGANDDTDAYSASLGGIFNGDVGTAIIFSQMSSTVLSTGTRALMWHMTNAALTYQLLLELNGANTIQFVRVAAGTKTLSVSSFTNDGDVMFACVWDQTGNDEMRMSINGVAQTPVSTLNAWSGALGKAGVGAYKVDDTLRVTGHLGWYALNFGTALTDQQLSDIYNLAVGA